MTAATKPRVHPEWERLRPVLVLVAALVGIATSLVTALDLVPRVRLVDVLTVFASGVGGGAGVAWSTMEFRQALRSARKSG
jgi:hypothetical protein